MHLENNLIFLYSQELLYYKFGYHRHHYYFPLLFFRYIILLSSIFFWVNYQ